MNKVKVLSLVIAGVVLLTALIILLGENKNHKEPFAEKPNPLPQEVSKKTFVDEQEIFLLIAEDNYLNLYNSDTNGVLKKSEQIDFNLFPAEDVEELREGKTFYSETEAYEMMENFVN
ncbi:MAG: hypothetical protein IJ423_02325 [Clostridia bacterium]|nr:hypothetical protein [Clostridia bacterium]